MSPRGTVFVIAHAEECDHCDYAGPCIVVPLQCGHDFSNVALCGRCCHEIALAMETFSQSKPEAAARLLDTANPG